ncbi:MAG: hypothetical protein SOS93_05840 [Mannheimia varigena]|nr:hypothetical protein [Mannheimia varigena]
MDNILITVHPPEAIDITIDKLVIIQTGDGYGDTPDFLTIYQQAKDLNDD